MRHWGEFVYPWHVSARDQEHVSCRDRVDVEKREVVTVVPYHMHRRSASTIRQKTQRFSVIPLLLVAA